MANRDLGNSREEKSLTWFGFVAHLYSISVVSIIFVEFEDVVIIYRSDF
jgi:hypothetical protein